VSAGPIVPAELARRVERPVGPERSRTDVVEHWPAGPLLTERSEWRTSVVRGTGGVLAATLVSIGSPITLQLVVLLVVAAAWVGGTILYSRGRPGSPRRSRAYAVVDLGILLTVAASTGGADADVRIVLCLAPFGWAATLDRRGFAGLVALGPLAFVALWLFDGPGPPQPFETVAALSAIYIAAVTIGLITLQLRAEAADRAAALQSARAALLHELSMVERTQHERMSNQLHDGPLQAFISAQQDLAEYREGDLDALPLAISTLDDGITELRRTIHELFRTDLADVGTKVGELCQTIVQRRGIAIDLQLDPELAALHNDVLVGIVGELVTNAVKHARATSLLVVMAQHEDDIRIVVRDDGVGMTLDDRDEAVESGHIGLSSIDRRVRALGGRWRIRSAPGRGTSVTVELPR
jgi:two-component system NarL family sensor kinase